MIQYSGMHHTALVTGDMDLTVRFWRDLLEMRLLITMGHPGYRQYFFEISENHMIAFFEWKGVAAIPEKEHGYPVQGSFAFDHIALGVKNDEDLWKIKDKLEAADFWVSEIVDHGFIHSLYSFDPNNIAIEFCAAVPGAEPGLNPKMRDREPVPSARYGPNPRPACWPAVKMPTPEDQKKIYPGEGGNLFTEIAAEKE
ncbi:MAG: VOC family protein [Desulfococcaceae bacterium]|nr:VOC family protein [Desulfococcaceae bacterium]